jgi:hypothetical protein
LAYREILTGGLLLCLSAAAAAALPVFDAHIHYSADVWDAIPPGRAMAMLSAAGISRAVVSATPAGGAERLYRAAPDRIVPFLRPYPSRAHRHYWYRDPEIPSWLRAQLARIPYRGIGEFHVFGTDAGSPVVQEVIGIARERQLALMAHTDPEGIAAILAQAPANDVIWAHAGFDVPIADLQDLLDAHPRLFLELSFREGLLQDGRLTPAWRCLSGRKRRAVPGGDGHLHTGSLGRACRPGGRDTPVAGAAARGSRQPYRPWQCRAAVWRRRSGGRRRPPPGATVSNTG